MNIIFFLIIILLTNAIQAITGFAGTLLAMPISMILIGVDEAKVVLNLITLITCVFIAFNNRKNIKFEVLKKTIIFMGIGMCFGIVIYKIVAIEFLLYVYGAIIIFLAIKNLFFKKEFKLSNAMITILLLVAGVIHGMFISGGALLVVYMAYELKNKDEFRATMSSVWVLLNTFLMGMQVYSGTMNKELITLTAIALIPAICGGIVGNKMHEKISKGLFMKLTYTLLLISGMFIFI